MSPRMLAATDQERQRLRRLAATFEKINRVVARDRSIKVRAMTGLGEIPVSLRGTPGWSAYPDITINGTMFPDLKKKVTLVQLLGLNYHELSHLLFTPRRYAASFTTAERAAWNLLEDQRIESLFTALYEPAGKYFTEMVIKMLVNDESAWPTAVLWSHGRSFLPLEIREEFEARFKGTPQQLKRAKGLIEKFVGFTARDFRINSYVMAVIRDFATLIAELQATTPDEHCGSKAEQKDGDVSEKQEKEASEADQERRKTEKETGEDQSGFWEDEDEDGDSEEDGDDEDNGAGSDSDSDDGEDGEESEDSGSPADDSELGDDGETDGGSSDSESGNEDADSGDNGESSGSESEGDIDGAEVDGDVEETPEGEAVSGNSHAHSQFDDEELKEYLDEIIDAVHEDDSVQEELDRITEAMNDPSDINVIDFGRAHRRDQSVGVEMAAVLEDVTQNFRRLYADVEPGWKYGSDHGKLNISRVIDDPDNYDEFFDEWDEGREIESGLEVFLSLDKSGSMHGTPMQLASEAMYIIKRACDSVEAKTTVVAFDDRTEGLYSRDEVAPVDKWPLWTDLGGSTEPGHSMVLARSVLGESPMPNKLFVIITDGGWSTLNTETGRYDLDFESLIPTIPGRKMYVGVNDGMRTNLDAKKLFDHVATISNPMDIVPLINDTITAMLHDVARGMV